MRILWALFWSAMTAVCRLLSLAVVVLAALLGSTGAHATVYFSFDAESSTVGSQLTNPPFCSWECIGEGYQSIVIGMIGATGGAPQGSKYFYWNIVQNQHSHYNEVKAGSGQLGAVGSGLPHTFSEGSTVYLAYWIRIERVGSTPRFNVFQTGADVYSAEKGTGLHGPNQGDGVRWDMSIGCWGNTVVCDPNKFTVFGGNPSFHFHGGGNGTTVQPCTTSGLACLEVDDVFRPNVNGYSGASPMVLSYDTWYPFVMKLTLSNTTAGEFSLWVNGTQFLSYTGIKTVQGSQFSIAYIELGGTLCQPAYDCPAHTRKYDAMMIADSWADVVAGGYVGGAVPVADFTCSPLALQAPASTNCTDASTNVPTSWAWSGGCGTSTNQNPALSCATGGMKDICLTSSNANGSSMPFCRSGYINSRYKKPSGVH